MRRALGLLALLAVMLAAAAHVVLRGSSGFASGSGAVVQAALTSIDYTSLVLGASAGMFLMTLSQVFQGPAYPMRRRMWSMRLGVVAVAVIGIAAMVYY